MRQFRAGRLLLSILVAATGWFVAPASAQFGELPQSIVESGQPTPEQIEVINKYISVRIADLESGEPARVKRGRTDLQSPAANAGATIAFRTAYSAALAPELSRLGKLDNDVVVIDAIQVAGSLATGDGIAMADRYRADNRPAVRYAAVFALRDTIRSISRSAPVVGPEDAGRIVDNLAVGLSTETEPFVADMYVRALLESTRVQQQRFEAIPDRALQALIQTVGTRVRKLGTAPADRAMAQPFLRAAEAIRDVMAEDAVKRQKPEDLARNAGGMGGDLLGYVFRRSRAGDLLLAKGTDPASVEEAKVARQPELTATQLGVTIVFSARDRLARGVPEPPPDLAGMLGKATAAGDKEFQREVLSIIGDGGLLTKDPFRFNADRFLK